jgi:hypothetical protein
MIKQKPASPSALDKLKETYFEVGVAANVNFQSKASDIMSIFLFDLELN